MLLQWNGQELKGMVAETAQSIMLTQMPPADFIFGCTPGMREVRVKIEKALDDDLPILIEGESGTGKEVVARYLHLHSLRASGPFVRVNCGAMPARSLEAEMFEPEQGTGSGSIGMAAGGTLFLDEIADMDLTLQGKVLQALSTGLDGSEGNRKDSAVNARFVCACGMDVQSAIHRHRVLQGLVTGFAHRVHLLPLRERKQDLPALCEYLIDKFAHNFGRPTPALSRYVLDAFQQWNWPGNIRELENWIARIVIFGTEEAIGLEFKRQMENRRGAVTRGHRVVRGDGNRLRRRRYS
jgi:DNA-binding NtrC family response regulator